MPAPLAIRVLGPSARGQLAPLTGAAGLGLVCVLLDLARPWPLAFAVDHAIGHDRVAGLAPNTILILAGIAIVALTALAGLLDMAAVVVAERAAERVGAALRQDLFEHSISLSPRWHDRVRTGEVISRLTTDVGRLLDALVAGTSTLLPEAVRIAVVLAVLVAFDVQLALVAVAVVPVLMVFAVRQRRRVRAAQRSARTESGRLASAATDLVRNVRAVQAFGRAQRSGAVFGGHNRAVRDANSEAVTVEAGWAPVADIVLAIGSGLVLVIGGREVLGGRLSTGDLLVVMSYLSALYSPVRGLSRLSGLLAKSGVSAARVGEVLACTDRVQDRIGARPAPTYIHEVRFAAVSFGYRADAPVLDRLDLIVRAGETVALVGPSGCGKSTALSLMLRLYDVDAGSITVNGIDVRDLRQADLRRRIAYVPQDAWLFDTTVAENIAYGAAAATRHEVVAAGRAALVEEFAGRLPNGYDTVIGEGGATLSGGQRRRIALARAVVSDAPLVLLDEPTASLDPASAAAVVAAIRRSTAGRTVLLVTHDLDLAATADRVIDLTRATARRVPELIESGKGVTS